MGSANKLHLKNPTTSSDTEDKKTSPNMNFESIALPPPPFTLDELQEDLILSKSEYLTRQEVIRRRYRRLKLEIKVYEDYYWALMEDYRVKHREYYWNYGKSPFKEEEEMENGNRVENGNVVVEGGDENGKLGLGINENCSSGGSGIVKNRKCAFSGCKSKAMALTNYCHLHILLDTKQKLYKACNYIVKSQHTGPVHCGKPILRSTEPSLCSVHFEKAQKHVTRALKKAGLNISSASKLAPKFHVIVAESVRHINTKRREKGGTTVSTAVVKEENAG